MCDNEEMKKILTMLLWLMLCSACNSTFLIVEKPTDYSTVVKCGKIKGVIFQENVDCFFFHNEKRFSPTIDDIQIAEKILKEKIKIANSSLPNQGGDCPIIHKHLNNYRRQYFGFINEEGDRIIYAKFEWNRCSIFDRLKGYDCGEDEDDSWKTEVENAFDGCSYYWSIRINIDKNEVSGLGVHGYA
jgi:hypothetical protein